MTGIARPRPVSQKPIDPIVAAVMLGICLGLPIGLSIGAWIARWS